MDRGMKAISIVALLVLVSTGCERKNEQPEGNELESSSKVDLNKLLSEALPLERLQERSVDAEKLFSNLTRSNHTLDGF